MHSLTILVLLFAGVTQIAAVCFPNTICMRERDTITQLDSSVSTREKLKNQGRAWYIGRNRNYFNAILAFKNFSSSTYASVLVIAYTTPTTKSTQYFFGDLGDFEVVIKNSIGVIIYVPINTTRTADFVLNYYTDCEILTSTQDQISYPQTHLLRKEEAKKCWFVQPTNKNATKRIYFSIRDVALNPGQQIVIWDVHTSQVITTTTDGERHKLAASATNSYQSVLIDLICTETSCDTKFNSFYISYYGMTQKDVDCIKKQSECEDSLSMTECNVTCPAFDNLIAEEYGLETNTVIPRSGSNSDTEEQETTQATTTRRRCPPPFKPKQCTCPKNVTATVFCNGDCPPTTIKNGRRCTYACIYHKVATCLKIKLLKSLKLL